MMIQNDALVGTNITREQVENGDFALVTTLLKKLRIWEPTTSPVNSLRHLRGNVGFFIDGYEKDSRELFCIPEVRRFFQQLHTTWPHGLYFLSRETVSLQLLVLSHVDVKATQPANSQQVTLNLPLDKVSEFIADSAERFFSISQLAGWTEQDATQYFIGLGQLFGLNLTEQVPNDIEEKRQRHKEFLKTAYVDLAAIAWEGFNDEGRGALIIGNDDPDRNPGCQAMYVEGGRLMEKGSPYETFSELHAMVERYNPKTHIVVCICEPNSSDSYCYGFPEMPPSLAYQAKCK